jgi:hypothetical protein
MRLADIPSARVVLLLGARRYGVSWLAKFSDSHPDVLYRHEPDRVLRTSDLPWMCPRDQVDAHVDQARLYLRQLFEIATLKTTGGQPMFPKRFESTPVHLLRVGIIDVLQAADLTKVGRQLIRQAHIADFLALDRHPDLRLVVKSVSSRGQARLFAEALPEARIIVILRDPWGRWRQSSAAPRW